MRRALSGARDMPTHGPINGTLAIVLKTEPESAERRTMPESLEDLIMLQPPTADRPLLGSIVLVVEDSRHACEAMRLICQRSGARIRRAESIASAERHLRTYRPRLAVIDLGLPDGSGLDLIETLSSAEPGIDGIIAISGDDGLQEAALAAGADAFMPKPLSSVAAFQELALGLLPAALQPPHLSRPTQDAVEPDPVAIRDDLALIADLLRSSPDGATLRYVQGFLYSLGKDTGDPELSRLAAEVDDTKAATSTLDHLAKSIQHLMDDLQPV